MKKDIQSYKHIYEKIDGDCPHPLFFCASGGQNALDKLKIMLKYYPLQYTY